MLIAVGNTRSYGAECASARTRSRTTACWT